MNNDEIKKLAHLACLNISDAVLEETSKNLSAILRLVNELQTIDTMGIKPLAHPLDSTQRLRKDTVNEIDQRASLQQIAPKTDSGLYLVPKVIE